MITAKQRVAILGAGPIGLEAALYARTLGFPVTVLEAENVGANIRAWGHVSLFTPWPLDVSTLGSRRRRETTGWNPTAEVCPTGNELVREYLEPLSRLPELAGCMRTETRVIGLSRHGFLKGEGIGHESRAAATFRILVESGGTEEIVEAEIVIDATGVFGQPNALGEGGMSAPGERGLPDKIVTGVPDVNGEDQARFLGKRVLVVGGGLSAATTICALDGLAGTDIHWATRAGMPPISPIPDDPLPHRLSLTTRANRLAGSSPSVNHLPQSEVIRLERGSQGVMVTLNTPQGGRTIEVDTVVNQTGFHPDNSLYRELQVHECYASQGPMKLAASLLGTAGGDCMTQEGFGPDSLKNPEPGFFILGNKSYGRNSQFLLRIGRDQVRDLFQLITGDRELDLYQREPSGV